MPRSANLRDEQAFPSFVSCPDENFIDFDYYVSTNGFSYHPRHQWCLLAEIVEAVYFFRLRLLVRDKSGEDFFVNFHLDNDEAFDPSQYQVGHTIAVLRPHQHRFLDSTVGIRQEETDSIQVRISQLLRETVAQCPQVIPFSLSELLNLSDKVQLQMAAPGEKKVCGACKKKSDSLLSCARCRLYWYCDKVCSIPCVALTIRY